MWKIEEDDLQRLHRLARRDFRRLAAALILQELLLFVTAFTIQDALMGFWTAQNPALTQQDVYHRLWDTGLDMIAASLVGLAAILLLLGKRLRPQTPGERMRPRQFLLALIGINGLQLLATLVTIPLERLVESLGYSLEQASAISTGSSATLSMFLYTVLVAPLVEEVTFRGAVLRWLAPWGQGFALFVSAALFGLMHNNLVQLPVAFACGLLFGYIAQRFSLRAAVAAHAANNLIVEVIGLLPDSWGAVWLLYSAAMLLSGAYLIYWCLTRRKTLFQWCRVSPLVMKWFLTSVPVLFLLVMYIIQTLRSALPA